MSMTPFVNTEYGKLKKVLLQPPTYLTIKNPINAIAEKNIRIRDIDKNVAVLQFEEEFVRAFESYGVEVIEIDPHPELVFAVNTRDLGVTTPKGILFGRFLKFPRWGEHRLTEDSLLDKQIPIYCKIDKGIFEGGDFVYLDSQTALVGHGCRTNLLGIKMLEFLLHDANLEIIPVDFDERFLHLDMICNVVGEKVAIVCPEALPLSIIKLLKDRKFNLITIPMEGVFMHECNLLSVGNDTIFSHPQALDVNCKLRSLGFNIEVIEMTELLRCGGGPRCMSFPLERE